MVVQTFRKKPVEIQAAAWDGSPEGASELVAWISENTTRKYLRPGSNSVSSPAWFDSSALPNGAIFIQTLEGAMTASPGDVIIRGVQGEFYPCKPDIFQATYDAA